ncbi:hypothetical protein [Spirochaeta thermophila]|uniref:Iron-sulfur binding hydrogenase n=1 Tax=Winmispira thermophila (strain ATCC 49972 / DSM 6192 / RI 19.B1) TaxID=665571 RepID=E0RUA1_WINT6|nr:hypothetical protein [Spirochaeta thermophila]ADN02322.1 hypothetical protein STHERM_c13820 [Spirochaeta thermophila DSM 6192]
MLTIKQIPPLVEAEEVLVPDPEVVVKTGYTSDLLSDVMANAPEDSVLITIQAHKNTIAVAILTGIRVVLVCNNRPIPEDMVEAAAQEGIAILRTSRNQFECSGILYQALDASS